MNKTVGKSDVSGFVLMFKAIQSNKVLGYLKADVSAGNVYNWDFENSSITFQLNTNESLYKTLKTGSSYKVQLAYVSTSGLIGYYSTVGVVKYTTNPKVEIMGLKAGLNINPTTFYGKYSQENGDTTEKVYSYRFDIYDSDGNIYDTSGDQIHNSFEDESLAYSTDKFVLNKDLVIGKNYYIQYHIKTINNLEKTTPRYRIIEQDTIDSELKANLYAEMNPEEGYISLGLRSEDNERAVGAFVLKRASNKDNYQTWQTIYKFKLASELPSDWEYKDFLIEHGYTYKYAVQQTNSDGFYSNKIYSNEVYASFEDMFLFDGKKQLKVRFNPKISSFKNTILETKQNTLGNKYPFIFRNGIVNYKEFPISGLISYWSDDEELFANKSELLLEAKMTDLLDENFTAERIFKLKVLDFLNDGEPKVFRSPSEGNYIVQLTGVSLSPNETVGRMLHSFSATASEVAEFNYDNLVDYGFVNIKQKDDKKFVNYASVDLTGLYNKMLLSHSPATSISIESTPGTQFRLTDDISSYVIEIGPSGKYQLTQQENIKIYSLEILNIPPTSGILTYTYESEAPNSFNEVANIVITDYPVVQFLDGINDVITYFENVETQILAFTFIKAKARDIIQVYQRVEGEKLYYDENLTNEVLNFDPYAIYKAYVVNNHIYNYYDGRRCGSDMSGARSVSGFNNKLQINDDVLDLTETRNFFVKEPGKITKLKAGYGIILECGLQTKTIEYSSAALGSETQRAREEYQKAKTAFEDLMFYDVENDTKNYFDESTCQIKDEYFTALASARAETARLKKEYLDQLKTVIRGDSGA